MEFGRHDTRQERAAAFEATRRALRRALDGLVWSDGPASAEPT
jgi:hypothetical protein